MATIDSVVVAEQRRTGAARVASVDVFRGLTMLVMIFVNDLAGVRGLPAWNYHMPAHVNAMSYVDMVFPTFLFVMGLSIPLSVRSRLTRGASVPELWLHIVLRSVSLMVLGLILANTEKADQRLMPIHLTSNQWGLLALFGAILFLNVYPKSAGSFWPMLSKAAGLLLVTALLLIFRRVDRHGHLAWLDFSYWEILGIIGWTYLATCVLYIPLRRSRVAPVLWLLLLCAFNMAASAHLLRFPNVLPLYLWPWNNGAFTILTMAGIVTTQIVLMGEWGKTVGRRLKLASIFGVILLSVGAAAAPLGISKIRATPTWCLVSAGVAVLLFLTLYWICDVHRSTAWSAFARPAGTNTLLTYLLPDLFIFGVSLAWLPPMWRFGFPGVLKAAAFTALILLIAAVLTRLRIRLQL